MGTVNAVYLVGSKTEKEHLQFCVANEKMNISLAWGQEPRRDTDGAILEQR